MVRKRVIDGKHKQFMTVRSSALDDDDTERSPSNSR